MKINVFKYVFYIFIEEFFSRDLHEGKPYYTHEPSHKDAGRN